MIITFSIILLLLFIFLIKKKVIKIKFTPEISLGQVLIILCSIAVSLLSLYILNPDIFSQAFSSNNRLLLGVENEEKQFLFNYKLAIYLGQFIGILWIMILYFRKIDLNTLQIEDIKPSLIKCGFSENFDFTELFKKFKERIKSCNSIFLIIILFWVVLYFFLSLTSINLIEVSPKNMGLILRLVNTIDSILMLILAGLFLAKSVDVNSWDALNVKTVVLTLIAVLVILELSLIGIRKWTNYEGVRNIESFLTLSGGLISGISFLYFFSRLDSIFLKLSQIILIVLFAYGILQILYPIEMLDYVNNNSSSSMNNFIIYFGYPMGVLGKIMLGYLFFNNTNTKKLGVYFICIFHYGNQE